MCRELNGKNIQSFFVVVAIALKSGVLFCNASHDDPHGHYRQASFARPICYFSANVN